MDWSIGFKHMIKHPSETHHFNGKNLDDVKIESCKLEKNLLSHKPKCKGLMTPS